MSSSGTTSNVPTSSASPHQACTPAPTCTCSATPYDDETAETPSARFCASCSLAPARPPAGTRSATRAAPTSARSHRCPCPRPRRSPVRCDALSGASGHARVIPVAAPISRSLGVPMAAAAHWPATEVPALLADVDRDGSEECEACGQEQRPELGGVCLVSFLDHLLDDHGRQCTTGRGQHRQRQ
jgi:hypothetical protein